MSAIEPYLEPNEMSTSTTSIDFLDSFKTVDEDKDSDEESFHLFLDGDDEINRSDEKLLLNEQEEDANKSNNEEKEKVNELIATEENISKTEETSLVGNTNGIHKEDENKDMDCSMELSSTEENIEEENVNKLFNENSESGKTNVESEVNKNDNKSNNKDLEENKEENETCIEKDSSTLMETEDDILNKHASENNDNNDGDLDPTLEDKLLSESVETNENDVDLNGTKLKLPVIIEPTHINNCETDTVIENSENSLNNKQLNVENEDSCVDSEQNLVNSDKESESNSVLQNSIETCDVHISDSEDLLDISMIKDSEQDNADIAEDALQLEKENEDSDNNTDRDNSKCVDNLENSDEDAKEDSSSDNINNESSDSDKEKDTHDEEMDEQNTDKDVDETKTQDEDDKKEDEFVESSDTTTTTTTTSKRNSSEDCSEPDPKKIKLMDTDKDLMDDKVDSWDVSNFECLSSLAVFMAKSKIKQLKKKDLEELTLQKICEAILHKSEIGELNQQLKMQEQALDVMRKEQAVLTKQIRDLEIVNRKLMHDVKCTVPTKALNPVRITRSVGLQVRMTQFDYNTNKRKPNTKLSPQKNSNSQNSLLINRPAQNNNVNRQILQKSPIKSKPPMTNQAPPNKNKLSSKVNVTIRPNARQKATPERKKSSESFIDLTEEDDKKARNQNSVKSTLSKSVNIRSVSKTTIANTTVTNVVTTTPQLMYVVQSNTPIKKGLLTTGVQQKALLVNFQPTNGVLGSLNTTSVSVIPKVASSIQIKPTDNSLLKNNTHPAPLPSPPTIQGPNDKLLKGVPPKPVLSIRKTNTGIILQWRMPYDLGLYEGIASYQLYAYQETSAPPSTDMWRKVGDVKAMALPMACTLTQFADKNKYYFAVRPVDIHKRIGRFSNPEEISL